MRTLTIAVVLVALSGCTDSRTKSATALLNAKTQTAATEYSTATSPEAKDAVAKDFFKTAPAYTQVIDDYTHGRQPSVTVLPTQNH